MSEADDSSMTATEPATDSATRGRRLRVPGGAAPAAQPVAAVAVETAEPGSGEDARTPGLRVLEDGAISYAGKVHRKPFQTPHGTVVPACSVEAPGLAGRR